MTKYKVLGLDFESQGLDIENVNATEIGAVLYEVTTGGPEMDKWEKLIEVNRLLWEPGYPPQPKDIIDVTGITDAMLRAEGRAPKDILFGELFPLMEKADFVLAHNKKFDKGLLHAVAKRNSLVVPDRRWICTYSEFPYGPRQSCKKLAHLGLDHGLPMDGRVLHRASDDVRLMIEVVGKYRFNEVIDYVNEPSIVIRAVIPAPWNDGGVGKENAIRRGFSWEIPRGSEQKFDKQWVKQIKQSKLQAEMEEAPFQIVKL